MMKTWLINWDVWAVVGFVGQAVFFSRIVVQGVYAERHKKSLVPVEFWVLSLIGSLIVLAYAIRRRDPVFTVGQTVAMVVYVRNLMWMRRRKQIDSLIGEWWHEKKK